MIKSRGSTAASKKRSAQRAAPETERRSPSGQHVHAARETIESIVMAVILAFLFRAFVAEAFVIPTGSMAPTLMGRHKDVECPQCHFRYQAGASVENEDQTAAGPRGRVEVPRQGTVVGTTCPLCRYRMKLDWEADPNQESFVGDRILVSKFLYDFAEPNRWDVIVFKFPFNAKENYIKRLVGLPNETVRIRHGDVFVAQNGDVFQIARKPDAKLLAMKQLIDDTDHVAEDLRAAGWPARWQPWAADGADVAAAWTAAGDGPIGQTEGDPGRDIWLRYHHLVPDRDDWEQVLAGSLPPDVHSRRGELITDFYGYNAFTWLESYAMTDEPPDPAVSIEDQYPAARLGRGSLSPEGTHGLNWVGDLVLEAEVDVAGAEGELLLQLVKGGVHNVCRIDVQTGQATLSREGTGQPFFESDDAEPAARAVAETDLQGPGQYDIRFSNVDAELRLWINGSRVPFAQPTTYEPPESSRPHWSSQEPGDLAPLGIGSRGLALTVRRLRVFRDVYYVATDGQNTAHEYRVPYGPREIRAILNDPKRWEETLLFDARNTLEVTLGPDEFFPLGDNSPQSSDARLWPQQSFQRDLLIGKALFIYWPHPWNRPIPYLPNFQRMRLIR